MWIILQILSVGFPPVADPCHTDQFFLVMNFINDSVLAYSDPIEVFVSGEFANARRSRLVME